MMLVHYALLDVAEQGHSVTLELNLRYILATVFGDEKKALGTLRPSFNKTLRSTGLWDMLKWSKNINPLTHTLARIRRPVLIRRAVKKHRL